MKKLKPLSRCMTVNALFFFFYQKMQQSTYKPLHMFQGLVCKYSKDTKKQAPFAPTSFCTLIFYILFKINTELAC